LVVCFLSLVLFIYYYRTEKHLLAEVFFVGDNVDATKPKIV